MTLMLMEVAAGIIFNGQKNILLCQRQGELAGLWEFPGGKREPGESFAECLEREIWEELGIKIAAERELCRMPYTDGKKSIAFSFQLARLLQDAPAELRVHQDARWVSLAELPGYPLCPADAAFVQMGRLQELG